MNKPRQEALGKLWNKLARNTFAIIDYDICCLNRYKPKITKAEARKLKRACIKAIDEALRIRK